MLTLGIDSADTEYSCIRFPVSAESIPKMYQISTGNLIQWKSDTGILTVTVMTGPYFCGAGHAPILIRVQRPG